MLCSSACCLVHVGFLIGSFFDPENGDGMFLQNVIWLTPDYMALNSRRQNSPISCYLDTEDQKVRGAQLVWPLQHQLSWHRALWQQNLICTSPKYTPCKREAYPCIIHCSGIINICTCMSVQSHTHTHPHGFYCGIYKYGTSVPTSSKKSKSENSVKWNCSCDGGFHILNSADFFFVL
jgi:hypothetical protein